MKHILRCGLLVVFLSAGFFAPPSYAQAQPVPASCVHGKLPHDALSLICVPASGWNGDVVIWAHGYTAFNEPLDFQNLTLPDGTSLPDLVQRLGFAFATTSFRTNGLAILQGADDIRELLAAFPGVAHRTARYTYMVGASEGGIITTLLVERFPQLFSGGMAMCGPIGDFRAQINYIGDFRVLFDFFFPGVIPGSPINIPSAVIDHWSDTYVPAVHRALVANPLAAGQLMRTANASVDLTNLSTVETTTIHLLWYNVFGTNDAAAKFGGNPYGNIGRWYSGSTNDVLLNLGVARFPADPHALAEFPGYATSGTVKIPLVTLHTTNDEIIPFWHELLYAFKMDPASRSRVAQLPVFRYGHCNFTTGELLGAFAILAGKVAGQVPSSIAGRADVQQVLHGARWPR